MTAPDPDALLRQLDPGLADLKVRAEQAREELATTSGSSSSADESVTVTVGPGGNLTGLILTDRALRLEPARLAAQIIALAGQAQRQASAQVVAAFGDLVGADSPAMDVLTPFLPPPAEDDLAEDDLDQDADDQDGDDDGEDGADRPWPSAAPAEPPPAGLSAEPPSGGPPPVPPAQPPPAQYGPPDRGPRQPPQPRRSRPADDDEDPDFWKDY